MDTFHSEPLKGDRETYVENLFKEIENRWVANKNDAKAFEADLRAFGGQLFDDLFPRISRSSSGRTAAR